MREKGTSLYMHFQTLEKRGASVTGVVLKEERLGDLLAKLGLTIDDVIVIVNGNIENDTNRVLKTQDRILITPALQGGRN